MAESEESKRISGQIASLSTQLIESIDKQSQLEEKLNQARRTIQLQNASAQQFSKVSEELESLKSSVIEKDFLIKELQKQVDGERELRLTAEKAVDELNKEVEDLTASLFDEANNMVATARRESHATEIKNNKLIEQLKEKDSILDTLTLQLKNLKKVLQNLEDANPPHTKNYRGSVIINDNSMPSSTSVKDHTERKSDWPSEYHIDPIYSPNVSSIRYDLSLFQEFLKFIAVLPHCQGIKDSASESHLLRRIVHDEIQPILRIDNASGLGWIVRRTLMSLMMDGLVSVEPLSGLNETYQFGNASPHLKSNAFASPGGTINKDLHLFNFPADSPPIAVYEKCSFCGESRRDVIEHARMHVLKTMTKADDGSLIVTNSFPLCNYCVLKLRQTCEIFAFLRSLKIGAWNLEKISLSSIANGESDKYSKITQSFKPVRKEDKAAHADSESASDSKLPTALANSTTNIQQAWLQLCKLRAMLHWTYIGIWSVNDSIASRFGPVSPQESDTDTSSVKTHDTYALKEVTTEDSFTLKKEYDDEDDDGVECDEEENEKERQVHDDIENAKKTEISKEAVTDANDQIGLGNYANEIESEFDNGETTLSEVDSVSMIPLTDSENNSNLPDVNNPNSTEQLNIGRKKNDLKTEGEGDISFHATNQIMPEANLASKNGVTNEDLRRLTEAGNDELNSSSSNLSNKEDQFDDAREEQSLTR